MKKTSIAIFLGALIFANCKEGPKDKVPNPTLKPTGEIGLAERYKDYFPMGVAIYPQALQDSATVELIKEQFNSMTPENVMKMGPIHPEEKRYHWEQADMIANFARENGLKLRGHTLVWHRQTGDWIFKGENGGQVGKEVLLQRMKSHITEVVTRYKDVIYAWDVVNEAISDEPEEFLRPSPWLEIIGEEYIIKAFQYAREADPDAQLFYNDYSAIRPEKREKILKLLKMLREAGAPIDGMGIQGHLSIYEPTEQELREALDSYTQLGLELQVTELDVSVYPKEHSARKPKKEDENDAFTAQQEEKQIAQYEMIFRVFRDYKNELSGVTFWNISDRYSWLDNFPVPGRKDYPLLFNSDLKPKKAFYKVTEF
ncbi:MAG: endo-1,4-beta-xylanase [Sediminicola sp.]